MLVVAKTSSRFAVITIRTGEATDVAVRSGHLGTLWRLRIDAGCVQGGTTKGTGHDDPQTPAIYRSRRKPFLSGTAAARHRGFPAHDRAAVCRPREIDPRTRRSDEERRADHARDAEDRVGR